MRNSIIAAAAAAVSTLFAYADQQSDADAIASGDVSYYEAGPSVTNVRAYAFAECRRLETFRADFAVAIGRNALMGCVNLKDVSLPAVTNLAYATTFNGCIRLENVNLPLIGIEAAKAGGFPWQTVSKKVVFHLADGDYDRAGRKID